MPQLTDLKINFLSLVPKGANKRTVVWKSADAPAKSDKEDFLRLIKTDEDKRLLYGVVYAPDDEDAHGDWASAEDIEKAAHDFLANAFVRNVDKDHDFRPQEGAHVAESFILRGQDPMFPDEKAGTWVVAIKIDNDETWGAVKKGEIQGLSMAGSATFIQTDGADGARKAFDFDTANASENADGLFWALRRAIESILSDEDVTDKQTAISDTLDQFKAAMLASFSKQQKSEKGFFAKFFNRLKGKENEEMTYEDVKKAVAEATKPLTDRLDVLEKANTGDTDQSQSPEPLTAEAVTKAVQDATKPLTERIEALEKQTPGTKQGEQEGYCDDLIKAMTGQE